MLERSCVQQYLVLGIITLLCSDFFYPSHYIRSDRQMEALQSLIADCLLVIIDSSLLIAAFPNSPWGLGASRHDERQCLSIAFPSEPAPVVIPFQYIKFNYSTAVHPLKGEDVSTMNHELWAMYSTSSLKGPGRPTSTLGDGRWSFVDHRDRHDQYNYQYYHQNSHQEHHGTLALRRAQRLLLCAAL